MWDGRGRVLWASPEWLAGGSKARPEMWLGTRHPGAWGSQEGWDAARERLVL